MRAFAISLAAVIACGCNCGGQAAGDGGTTGGASSGSTTAASGGSSAGASNGSSSSGGPGSGPNGSSGGRTSAGSASSGSAASTASSGGSSNGGIQGCGANAVWINDVCTAIGCDQAAIGTSCVLPGGGSGFCAAGVCQGVSLVSPSNCGGLGVQCPAGEACALYLGCVNDAGTPGCDALGGSGGPPCPAGTECDTNRCIPDVCTAQQNDQVCLSGPGIYTFGFCCGATCITDDDPANCGACGLACALGDICTNGVCVPARPCSSAPDNSVCALPSGTTGTGFCCRGACQDPSADTQECGACGQSCTSLPDGGCLPGQGPTVASLCAPLSCAGLADGLACSLPSVLATAQAASSPQYGPEVLLTECCDGSCVDLDFDPANCGSCGVVCPAGTVCQDGRCGLGLDCALSGEQPPGGFGACWLGPPTYGDGACCAGTCVNVALDPNNCSGCGWSCGPGATCAVGFDSPLCTTSDGGSFPPTPPACGPTNNGAECPLDGDGGGYCCGGACVTPSIEDCPICGLGCLPCFGGCPTGSTCVTQYEEAEEVGGTEILRPIDGCLPTACTPGTNGGPCAFGPSIARSRHENDGVGSCCNGVCVDEGQDPNNCGTCGAPCSGVCLGWDEIQTGIGLPANIACMPTAPSGDCLVSCPSGSVCALGNCVDSFCRDPYFAPLCAAANGNVGACCPAGGSQSWYLSNFGYIGAACADLANDPSNCGGCGFTCPTGQTCNNGVCSGTPAACGLGRVGAYCNLDAGPNFLCCPGVGCTDSSSDSANCGLCGIQCPAGQTCSNGGCS